MTQRKLESSRTLWQILPVWSTGAGLGRTTLTSSLPHSRADHSSTTSARTKPKIQKSRRWCQNKFKTTRKLTNYMIYQHPAQQLVWSTFVILTSTTKTTTKILFIFKYSSKRCQNKYWKSYEQLRLVFVEKKSIETTKQKQLLYSVSTSPHDIVISINGARFS